MFSSQNYECKDNELRLKKIFVSFFAKMCYILGTSTPIAIRLRHRMPGQTFNLVAN